jgi:hypothetical protein
MQLSNEWLHTSAGAFVHSQFKLPYLTEFYRICACISRIFSYKNLPSKIGVQLIHGILRPFDDWARDTGTVCCETPTRDC